MVEKQRINARLPVDLLEELSNYAESMGMTRTGALTMIIKKYLDEQEIIKMTKELKKRELKQKLEKKENNG